MNTCDKVSMLLYLYLADSLEYSTKRGKPEMTTPCSVVHCFILYGNYSLRVYENFFFTLVSHILQKAECLQRYDEGLS